MLLPINLSFNKEDVLIPVVAIVTVDKACRIGRINVSSKRSMRSKWDESRVSRNISLESSAGTVPVTPRRGESYRCIIRSNRLEAAAPTLGFELNLKSERKGNILLHQNWTRNWLLLTHKRSSRQRPRTATHSLTHSETKLLARLAVLPLAVVSY